MDWDSLQHRWTRMRPSLRHRWGRLSEDDLDAIGGRREVFVSLVQDRYSLSKREAEQRIEEWLQPLQEEKVLTGRA